MTGPHSPTAPPLDRLLLPDEARRAVLSRVGRLETERIALDQAAGRVLAERVVAAEAMPPFAAATMDGYAVVADDDSPWREVIGDQAAGYVAPVEVTVGTAVRITTGAPLPPGADAVVPVEATETAEDHIVVLQDGITPGQYIRPVGADLAPGAEVLPAGTLLDAPALALLASVGAVPVPVGRRPRAGVLSTGDELVEPGSPVGPGQIRDANRFGLVAALAEAGAETVWAGRAPDDRSALRALLVDLIERCDVVVTSGGVSMGHLDLVKALLPEVAEVHFRRVFMKPGKPLNFATAGRTLLFGLPGNPVSALVSCELFIRPALATMLGRQPIDRPRLRVRLAAPTATGDRIEYQRARIAIATDGRLVATVTGGQASSRLASFVGANALLVIPPGDAPLPADSELDAILLAPPFGPP